MQFIQFVQAILLLFYKEILVISCLERNSNKKNDLSLPFSLFLRRWPLWNAFFLFSLFLLFLNPINPYWSFVDDDISALLYIHESFAAVNATKTLTKINKLKWKVFILCAAQFLKPYKEKLGNQFTHLVKFYGKKKAL